MRKFLIAALGLLLLVPASGMGAPRHDLSVLFLFTFECPQCLSAVPLLEDLNHRYPVQGIAFRVDPDEIPEKKTSAGITFPVRTGSEAVKKRFGVKGVPAIVVLSGSGRVRERLVGGAAARSAGRLLEDLSHGGLGVLEVVAGRDALAGREVSVTGWISRAGRWLGRPAYYLTNNVEKIRIEPRPPVSGPSTAQDGDDASLDSCVDRLVEVKGTVRAADGTAVLEATGVRPLSAETSRN